MQNLVKVLIVLAGLTFILAVIASRFTGGSLMSTGPEAFSRASTNLALLAIAVSVVYKGQQGS